MTVNTAPSNLLTGKPSGGRWLVQNLGAADIYVARSQAECTTTAGVRISENEAFTLDEPIRGRNGGNGLWARTAAGTADVRVLRVG